jgi:hypothetical protein
MRPFCERRDGRDEMAEILTQAPVQALLPRSRDPNRWQIVERGLSGVVYVTA